MNLQQQALPWKDHKRYLVVPRANHKFTLFRGHQPLPCQPQAGPCANNKLHSQPTTSQQGLAFTRLVPIQQGSVNKF